MSDTEKKQPLYIKLDRELYDLLQAQREKANVTQISIIENALRLYLKGNKVTVDNMIAPSV